MEGESEARGWCKYGIEGGSEVKGWRKCELFIWKIWIWFWWVYFF